MPIDQFDVLRDGTLLHNDEVVDRFADPTTAADMAVRYAQDCDLDAYSVYYR